MSMGNHEINELRQRRSIDGDSRSLLIRHKSIISRSLTVSDSLLADLRDVEYFHEKINDIERHQTAKQKVNALLEILRGVPHQHVSLMFTTFVNALRRDGQDHVANIFHKESDEHLMSDKNHNILINQVNKCLIPSNDLLEKLVSDEVFSFDENNKIMEHYCDIERMSQEFVDVMSRKPESALKKFVAALVQTGQIHVATLLGEQSDVVPMSEKHLLSLVNVTEELVEFMDPEPVLIRRLTDQEMLRLYDVQRINAKKDLEAKCREIINILVRKPDSAFQGFIDALCETGQQHVATILGHESTEIPMISVHRQRLIGKRQEISRTIDVDESGLVDVLVSKGVLTERDRKTIKTKASSEAKSLEFLDILVRKSDSAFNAFIDALDSINHGHVARIIGTAEQPPMLSYSIPMTEAHSRRLNGNRIEISSYLDPENTGLVDKLVKERILSTKEANRIRVIAKADYDAKSLELLDILAQKSDAAFDAFIDALESTGQSHVAYIITGNGELPMSYLRRQIFDIMKEKLNSCLTLENNHLLEKLIKSGVISHADEKMIKACKPPETDKNKLLIWLINRKPSSVFDKFIEALRDSGFQHIAAALKGLDVNGEVEPKFKGSSLDGRTEYIVRITRKIQELATGSDVDGIKAIRSLIEENGFEVSSVREGSILITFRCFTGQSLQNLKRLYTDKTLDKLLSEVFCPEFAYAGLDSLSLNIAEHEFEVCAERFNEMGQMSVEYHEASRIHQLPLELLELMLMKAIVRLFTVHCQGHHDTRDAIQLAYSMLAVVCYNWWETMNGWPESPTKYWFKRKVRQAIQKLLRSYVLSPYLQSTVQLLKIESNWCLAICGDILFGICSKLRSVFMLQRDATQWSVLDVAELEHPLDIVACDETQQLYVYDAGVSYASHIVWRVSMDGRDADEFVPGKISEASSFRLCSLAVRKGRLLTISPECELALYGPYRTELTRFVIQKVKEIQHAVETPTGTFVISCRKPRPQVIEVNDTGNFIRVFNGDKLLGNPRHLALDADGWVFVVDSDNSRVLLLNNQLEMERVLLDRKDNPLVALPSNICFAQDTSQLFVLGRTCVQCFVVRRSIHLA